MVITALVVDNNPVLLKAVSTLLEQEGCQVRTACNGLEALEILHEYQPEIIFTDLIMPLVGGDKLCKIIRKSQTLKNTFIVILSAVILEDRDRILHDIDYDACIAKGNIKELREHLREALGMFTHKIQTGNAILGDKKGKKNEGPISVMQEVLSEKYHLKDILENLNEGIIELSREGQIVSLNQAAQKIFKRDMEEMIGVELSSLSWGNHSKKITDWICHDLLGAGGSTLEVTESDPLTISKNIVTASFVPIKDREHIFAVCIFRDITRQYLAEKRKREFDNAIRLVNRMEALSCMAGGVAHDFNNLLTAICGNLEIIDLTDVAGHLNENRVLLENTRKAASLAVDLIRKISCFSPFGIIRRENVLIQDLVEKVVKEIFKGKSNRISCTLGTKKTIVSCDPEQIATALKHVFDNALEAGEGQIRVQVAERSFATPLVRYGQYVPEGDFVGITVQDYGKGIGKEELLKIFDPYYSTKQRGSVKGMGLGLTIVYSTLRNHGGYVVVESAPGRGTELALYLPLLSQVLDERSDPVAGVENKKKILIMERDEQLQVIEKIMLEYLGLQPVIAIKSDDAQEIVRRAAEEGNPIGLAIVDLSGYGKNDGVTICKALHEVDADLKVVVSSGALMDPVISNYKEYGFAAILSKPYTLDDLKRITSIL